MTSEKMQNQNTFFLKITEESDLSLEVVILVILGVFMLLFGFLLFQIHMGALPYTPDSTYGLFLVIVSLQIITMGKTPFGDLRRSWILITVGIGTAIIGMTAGFIPGYLSELVRLLVGFMLLAGGIALILQLFFSRDKAKTWIKASGMLQHLTIACTIVYALTIVEGVITLQPGIIITPQIAVITIIYGLSFFYLSWCLHKVSHIYPSNDMGNPEINTQNKNGIRSKGIFKLFREASLSLTFAVLILMGVLLTLLGILLFPVNSGLIPFSPDGQFGLLLFIFSIQMMALGETLLGPFKRSWLMVIIGLAFAVLGIFSCIVPGILTVVIPKLIGSLSIIGGALLITQRFLSQQQKKIHENMKPDLEKTEIESINYKLMITQTLINIVAIVFGISALMEGLLPGMIVAGLLVTYGLILFVLVFILHKMTLIEIKGKDLSEAAV